MKATKRPVTSLLLIAALFVVYAPGLSGPFVLDDEENIVKNSAIKMEKLDWPSIREALLGNDSGPLKRPLASLSFALNHLVANGFDNRFAFKIINLSIHAFNAALIYWLTLLLSNAPTLRHTIREDQRQLFAIFAATAWALHPIQLTSVLYVVQRMTSLSALFSITGLALFVHGRMALETNRMRGLSWMTAGIIGGVTLGAASKETAILLPLYALAIEYSLFSGGRAQSTLRELRWFYAVTVLLPALVAGAYLAWNPDFLTDSYATRHFTLPERLLTEARILWLYIKFIFIPIGSDFSLFHDDIVISTGLLSPITTLLAVLGWLGMFSIAIYYARQYRVLSFAVLWYLAGHLLESSIFGLELAFEHRNYLPSYGILFALSCGLATFLKSRPANTFRLTAISICASFAFVTWANANTWNSSVTLAHHEARAHPNSARANGFAAHVSMTEQRDIGAAIKYTIAAIAAAPHEVGFRINLQIFMAAMARDIEKDPATIKQIGPSGISLKIPGVDTPFMAMRTPTGLQLNHQSSSPREIADMLRTQPTSAQTIASLEWLRHCLLDPAKICAPITGEAKFWFANAAENDRTWLTYRAIILRNNALIYADVGDYALAANYMQDAVDLLPEFPVYRIEFASYLKKLGRTEEAQRLLKRSSGMSD